MSMEQPRAIIIGGGVCGLAAALRLAEGGRFAPRVLEREDRPGGLARSLHFKGVSTDLGPHRIHTEIDEVERLIERIAAPSLITVQRSSHIYLCGKYLKYPPSPVEMTLRLGPWRMARFAFSYAAGRLGPDHAPETYETLMRRSFGRELYEFLIRPYSAKTWKLDPAEMHADVARVRVSAGSLARMVSGLLGGGARRGGETSLKQFRYVKGGAERLVAHLREAAEAAGAELRLESDIETLEMDEAGRVTGARRADGTREGGPDDVYLSTVPLPLLLGRLLPERPALAEAREAAAGLQYLDMIFVGVIVRRKVITGDNWLYFPGEDLVFNRAYEAKNFDPDMGPEDRSVLCVEITHRCGDAIAGRDDAAIADEVVRQLAATGLFSADEVAETFVHRLPYGYPLYTLDYAERVERALAGLRGVTNLLTVGRQGLFNHNNMDHSIWMGLRAADALNAHGAENGQADWYANLEPFRRMRIVD